MPAAQPWMKIEWALPDKPEVSAIAKYCEISRYSTLGRLVCVFAWYNGTLALMNVPVVTKDAINRIAGHRKFADAMIECGWLLDENGVISVPKFSKHNGSLAKQRAQNYLRQAKARTTSVFRRVVYAQSVFPPPPLATPPHPGVVLPVDTATANTTTTTKDNCTSQEADQLQMYTQSIERAAPDWLPMEEWETFIEMRHKLGKPMTVYAQELAVAKLGRLRAYGHDPKKVLEQSILGSWTGLYEIKPDKGNGAPAAGGFNERDYASGATNEKDIEWFRDVDGPAKS
jgi:hypothetical protein